MATKVKGITIELSADASGLEKALKDVNSSMSTTQKSLNDINKMLKFDPTNTTLLKQKTEELQKQIGNCKEKLDTLKKAQEDMDQNGIDKNSEQYMALQREIIATETELQKLESTAGSGSSELNIFGENATAVGGKMEDLGGKLMVVTAALAAVSAAAIAAFEEVDEGADTVIKKTGATGEAAEELEGVYEKVATQVKGDFADVGAAVGEIATRFGLTGDELEDLSTEFMKFADINDVDVESAVQNVDMALKTFNVDQSETKNVMGLLTKACQDSGISMDTLTGLLQSSGASLKEMGLDIDESISLMAMFEQNGIDSATMLGKMQKAASYYNEAGLDMNAGLQDLIERLQDSSTEAEATAEAYDIFGTRAGLAFVTAAKEGKISLNDLSTDLEDYADVVGDTYEATLDGTDNIAIAWKSIKTAFSELGKVIGNTLAPIMEKLAESVKKVAEKFNSLSDEQKETIVKIGLIVAAVGPLVLGLGKVVTVIGSISKALSALKFTSLLTNPITICVAAAAALVTGLGILVNSFDSAKKEAEAFKESNEALISSIDEEVASWNDLQTAQQTALNEDLAQIENCAALKKELDEIVDVNGNIKEGYEERAATITGILSEALGTEIEITDGVIGNYAELCDQIDVLIQKKEAQAILDSQYESYVEAISQKAQAEKDFDELSAQLVEAQKGYNEARNNNDLEGMKAWNDTKNEYLTEMGTLADTIAGYDNAITIYEDNLAKATLEDYDSMSTSVADYQGDLEDGNTLIEQSLQDMIDTEERKLSKAKRQWEISGDETYLQVMKDEEQLIAMLKGYTDSAGTEGANFATGYATAIRNGCIEAANAGAELAASALAAVQQTQDSHSPSKVTKGLGGDFGEGFTEGIDEKTKAAVVSAQKLVNSAVAGMGSQGRYGSIAAGANGTSALETLLRQYLPAIANGSATIVMDSGELVGAIANKMDKSLGQMQGTRQRSNLCTA